LLALGPRVHFDEADRLAEAAFAETARLTREYRAVRPASLHNILVNARLRERGLCYHWAKDLLAEFDRLEVPSLRVIQVVAREGTRREHSALVVVAEDQALNKGILLDAWRHSGRLFWIRVDDDRYLWRQWTGQ
jgi:hypothetical protein